MIRAHLRRYGALDSRLNVQKVRLAGCLRAPPRSWTLLLALAGVLRQGPRGMIKAHLLRWRPRPPCHVTREAIGPTNVRLRGPDMAPHSPYASRPRVRPSGAASQLDPSHRSSRVSSTGSSSRSPSAPL